jgi:putative cardiolipin synthase
MRRTWDEKLATPDGQILLAPDLGRRLKAGNIKLVWAPAELTADHPDKIDQEASIEDSKPLSRLEELLRASKGEFNAVSAYFVPGDYGTAGLKRLAARGVKVRVLTNALAATDVVAVHTGYRKYREELLKNGIELYEFKPIGGKRAKQRVFGSSGPPRASLHSKFYTVDGKDVIVGSYNLDPRSTELNTEIAIVIHSRALAAQANKLFYQLIAPEQSYKVISTKEGLRWLTRENGQDVVYDHEPGAGIGRSLEAALMSLLPIEDQL